MLDLALACDLKTSDPGVHATIRQRHQAIKSQRDAADYIREVENKIHSRRKFTRPASKSATASSAAARPLAMIRTLSSAQSTAAILLLLVAMVVAGWFAPAGVNLVLVALSMVLLMVVLGLGTTSRPLGILINERNVMSLSRFQMVVWTIMVLSGYLTFALVRIKMMASGAANGTPITDPLGIGIDWHLWALLGISTTSLVGAPLLLSPKKNLEPVSSVTPKTAQMLNEPEQDVIANKQGTLYANSKLSDARLTDMFEGDELMNTARIDLAKVQMFYFTIVAAMCFFVMVIKTLTAGSSNLDNLPSLPEGFVAVLGISHAGYLTSKGVNHTQSQP